MHGTTNSHQSHISDTADLRAALRAAANVHLRGKSDRRFALSLANQARALSGGQIHYANELLRRADTDRVARQAAPVVSESELWGTQAPLGSSARAGDRTFDNVAPKAAPSVVEVKGADLEACVSKVLAPLFASTTQSFTQRADELDGTLSARQSAFEANAAKVIAREVLKRALEELEARKPRQVNVSVTDVRGTRNVEGHKHVQFEHLLRAASIRLADGFAPGIFIAGERSSGKSHGARMLAKALDLPFHFNGAISFPHEMLGFIDAGGAYHGTPFRQAYEFGGVYCFDECDRSDPVALLSVNPHLANGIATFPDKQVVRHPDCIIVCTANTWGHGANAEYSGASKLDGAFLSRFPVQIEWNIDPALEENLVGHGPWLDHVRAKRATMREKGMKACIDVRTAQAGQALLAAGYSVTDAAKMTYLAALKPDQREMLK